MSVAARCLIESQYAPNAAQTLYTSPSNTVTIIDKFTATNSSVSTATVSIYLVPSGVGSSFGPSNLIVDAASLVAHATLDITDLQNQILGIGDYIAVVASAATSIVVRASGRQIQ